MDKEIKLSNDLGKKVFQNNFEILFEKNKKNKFKTQVNFIGDLQFISVLSTYKTMNKETQKSFIQRAVYKLAKEEHPEWFENLEK